MTQANNESQTPDQPAPEFAFLAVQEENERLRHMLRATEDRVIYLQAMLYQAQAAAVRNESMRLAQIAELTGEIEELKQPEPSHSLPAIPGDPKHVDSGIAPAHTSNSELTAPWGRD